MKDNLRKGNHLLVSVITFTVYGFCSRGMKCSWNEMVSKPCVAVAPYAMIEFSMARPLGQVLANEWSKSHRMTRWWFCKRKHVVPLQSMSFRRFLNCRWRNWLAMWFRRKRSISENVPHIWVLLFLLQIKITRRDSFRTPKTCRTDQRKEKRAVSLKYIIWVFVLLSCSGRYCATEL